jgi:transcriptional regulator with XRE-family HTH domain
MEEFGAMLRELREKARLTQQALAVKAGLSLSYVARLEQGGANPSWTTVKALCQALGVSSSAFERNDPFTGEEKPKKRKRK